MNITGKGRSSSAVVLFWSSKKNNLSSVSLIQRQQLPPPPPLSLSYTNEQGGQGTAKQRGIHLLVVPWLWPRHFCSKEKTRSVDPDPIQIQGFDDQKCKKPSALKREQAALQKKKFINFFLCLLVIFALRHPIQIRIRIRIYNTERKPTNFYDETTYLKWKPE